MSAAAPVMMIVAPAAAAIAAISGTPSWISVSHFFNPVLSFVCSARRYVRFYLIHVHLASADFSESPRLKTRDRREILQTIV
jgi:hypothetical protein